MLRSASFFVFTSLDRMERSSLRHFVNTESSIGCFCFMPLHLLLVIFEEIESLSTSSTRVHPLAYLGISRRLPHNLAACLEGILSMALGLGFDYSISTG